MSDQILDLPVSDIRPGPNDRRRFADLDTLAANIAENGLAQPITVRPVSPNGNGTHYEIVAGERRWRAHKLLDAATIPAIVRPLTEEEAAAVMLFENTARADLDPIEEASAYARRIDRFDWSIERCAEAAGQTAQHVSWRLKLLDLRDDVQDLIAHDQLGLGYAYALAHAGLDANFQQLAIRRLRDNSSPTVRWFRRVVGQLAEKQNQQHLFDDGSLFAALSAEAEAPAAPPADPPHPFDGTTPDVPDDVTGAANRLLWLIGYWRTAADEWHRRGNIHHRTRCQAATVALEQALAAL